MLSFIMFSREQFSLEVNMMKNKITTLILSVLIGVFCIVPVANASTRSAEVHRVMMRAESYIGTRYVLGGSSYRGIDCSGLTMKAYRAARIYLPRISTKQYTVGYNVSSYRLATSDLVFFSFNKSHTISHVGIYLSHGKFINATSHKGVTISRFSPYWRRAYVGAKRVI